MIPYSKDNKNYKYLLTVIDCFSKFGWAIPIYNKSGIEIYKAFKSIFTKFKRIPNKIQTDLGKEFYNKDVKKLFKENNIIHFSTHSNVKASIVERFNRTLKEKMWKYFTENKTNKWIDILDSLIDNYNSSYHRSIKMSPLLASNKENSSQVENNLYGNIKNIEMKKPRYKVGDKVRINKYKSVFAKGYLPNYTSEIFVISEVVKSVSDKIGEYKIKDPVITYRIKDLSGEDILGIFYEEELVLVKQ